MRKLIILLFILFGINFLAKAEDYQVSKNEIKEVAIISHNTESSLKQSIARLELLMWNQCTATHYFVGNDFEFDLGIFENGTEDMIKAVSACARIMKKVSYYRSALALKNAKKAFDIDKEYMVFVISRNMDSIQFEVAEHFDYEISWMDNLFIKIRKWYDRQAEKPRGPIYDVWEEIKRKRGF